MMRNGIFSSLDQNLAKSQLIYHRAAELKKVSRFGQSIGGLTATNQVTPSSQFGSKRRSRVSINPTMMSLGKDIPLASERDAVNDYI